MKLRGTKDLSIAAVGKYGTLQEFSFFDKVTLGAQMCRAGAPGKGTGADGSSWVGLGGGAWHQLSQEKGVCAIIEHVVDGGQEAAELRFQADVRTHLPLLSCVAFLKQGWSWDWHPGSVGRASEMTPCTCCLSYKWLHREYCPAHHSQLC